MTSYNFCVLLIIFLAVWTIGKSTNAGEVNKKKYDSNSVEQNQKILRLLLRLAFHTANHLVRLKDVAKIRAENELDKDLQDITMKDIIQGVTIKQSNQKQSQLVKNKSTTDTDMLDIHSRFLSFDPQTLGTLIPIKKLDDTVKNIVTGNTNELNNISPNLELLTNQSTLQNLQNKSLNLLNSTADQVLNPINSSNLTNSQDIMGKVLSDTAILNPMQLAEASNLNPLPRFLSEPNDKNINDTTEHVNEMEKIDGRFDSIVQNLGTTIGAITAGHINQSSSPGVIKRETSPVPVSVSTHVKNQTSNDHISVGNFSTSNITDSSNGANNIKGKTNLIINLSQSEVYGDKDSGISCSKDTPNIFEYIFDSNNIDDIDEDNYKSDVMEQFEGMKLQDFSNQLINVLEAL